MYVCMYVCVCVRYVMVFMRCRSEKQRVKGRGENCREGGRDTGRLRANFRIRVLAAPPEGTLSIRVAKEILSYVGSATL